MGTSEVMKSAYRGLVSTPFLAKEVFVLPMLELPPQNDVEHSVVLRGLPGIAAVFPWRKK